MRIAIATVQIPFVTGGAEYLARDLKQAFLTRGYEAEIVTMPFIDQPVYRIEDHIIAARMMDLNRSWAGDIDLCVGLKFPAYYMPHHNKVIWALHQHRAAYDLFDTKDSNLRSTDRRGLQMRNEVYRADNAYLREAKRIYTISGNVSARLRKYNGISSVPLYPPCPGMKDYFCESYGDYILMPSRVNSMKRQMLALQAMRHVKTDVQLYIVGKADTEAFRRKLLSAIEEYGLSDRVRYFDFVSDEEKLRLYAQARAVLFIPVDEDYGYITLEAMSAVKPVVTATDSGGPLEFVADGENGFVTEPSPEAIAAAMDRLFMDDGQLARQMGERAKKSLGDKRISWDYVVEELTRK